MPQSLSRILVHLVFSTKNREPKLPESVREPLCAYLGAVLSDLDSPAIAIGTSRDHIHLLLVLSRTHPLSRVVMEVKRATSKWLKQRGPAFANFAWQNGYGAFSIAQSGVEQISAYIARQEEHHRTRTFEDEYRALLKLYRVVFDERYVWD